MVTANSHCFHKPISELLHQSQQANKYFLYNLHSWIFYILILIQDKFLYPICTGSSHCFRRDCICNMEWTYFPPLTVSHVEGAFYSTKVYGCLAGQSLTVKCYDLSQKIILKCKWKREWSFPSKYRKLYKGYWLHKCGQHWSCPEIHVCQKARLRKIISVYFFHMT